MRGTHNLAASTSGGMLQSRMRQRRRVARVSSLHLRAAGGTGVRRQSTAVDAGSPACTSLAGGFASGRRDLFAAGFKRPKWSPHGATSRTIHLVRNCCEDVGSIRKQHTVLQVASAMFIRVLTLHRLSYATPPFPASRTPLHRRNLPCSECLTGGRSYAAEGLAATVLRGNF